MWPGWRRSKQPLVKTTRRPARRRRPRSARSCSLSRTCPIEVSAAFGLLHEQGLAQLFQLDGAVPQPLVLAVDLDDRGLGEAAGDERFGERVFDVLLQGAPQRPGAV